MSRLTVAEELEEGVCAAGGRSVVRGAGFLEGLREEFLLATPSRVAVLLLSRRHIGMGPYHGQWALRGVKMWSVKSSFTRRKGNNTAFQILIPVVLNSPNSGATAKLSARLSPNSKIAATPHGPTSGLPAIHRLAWWRVLPSRIPFATAILDRLLHHSTTINIRGERYRLKDRRKAGLLPPRGQEGAEAAARSLASDSVPPKARQKTALGSTPSEAKEAHS